MTRLAVVLCAALLIPQSAPAAELSRYRSHSELTAALKELAQARSPIASMVEIGKSREGRSIWAVEIASRGGAPVETRPAVLLAANLEGDQLFGSALALYVVDSLLGAYDSNPDVKRRIDTQAFYIIPRLNPDAAEHMFAKIRAGRKTNAAPLDDDNDGRVDEDGPEDLNGDGIISLMRVKDPRGRYARHPDEPRLLRLADPQRGESGVYSVYSEGIDNDGDGFINEDPPGGVDLNRNFQHRYPYYTPDAGRHMVSEPESRALMDYVLRHRNIGAILTFGESDNLVNAPNRRGELGAASAVDLLAFAQGSTAEARKRGVFQVEADARFPFGRMFRYDDDDDDSDTGRRPPARPRTPPRRPVETVNAADVEYFRAISEKYRALTGTRATPAVRAPAGAFFEYGYYHFGVPSFSTPGWGLPAPQAGGRGTAQRAGDAPAADAAEIPTRGSATPGERTVQPSSQPPSAGGGTAELDLQLLKWMDSEKIDGFSSWTAYRHPSLGEVEIGGFKPYATSNPPPAKVAELGRSHADFVLYLASLLPRVSVAHTDVVPLGGGLFRIKAEIANSGFLPTAMAHGVVSRSVKPTMVQLGVNPENLVSGDAKTSFFQALKGSGRRQRYEWIVRGKRGSSIPLKVLSQKGGAETVTLTLE